MIRKFTLQCPKKTAWRYGLQAYFSGSMPNNCLLWWNLENISKIQKFKYIQETTGFLCSTPQYKRNSKKTDAKYLKHLWVWKCCAISSSNSKFYMKKSLHTDFLVRFVSFILLYLIIFYCLPNKIQFPCRKTNISLKGCLIFCRNASLQPPRVRLRILAWMVVQFNQRDTDSCEIGTTFRLRAS